MFRSRRIRVLVAIGVALDLAAIALAVGLHERTAAATGREQKLERQDRLDAGLNTIYGALVTWTDGGRRPWPPAQEVTEVGLTSYLPDGVVWPTNPVDGRPMHPGDGPGDYRYETEGGRDGAGYPRFVLTGTDVEGQSLDYAVVGGPRADWPEPAAGAVFVEGSYVGSGGEFPDGRSYVWTGLSLDGSVRPASAATRGALDLRLTDQTKVFDVSGAEVPTAEQSRLETTTYYWRGIARESKAGWTAVRLQVLVSFQDRP